jgi:metal-dependent amidase/aminoacylase/carboxypeptidase family protein
VALLEEAAAISGEISGLRHAIHADPEIGFDLPSTQQKVPARCTSFPTCSLVTRRLDISTRW